MKTFLSRFFSISFIVLMFVFLRAIPAYAVQTWSVSGTQTFTQTFADAAACQAYLTTLTGYVTQGCTGSRFDGTKIVTQGGFNSQQACNTYATSNSLTDYACTGAGDVTTCLGATTNVNGTCAMPCGSSTKPDGTCTTGTAGLNCCVPDSATVATCSSKGGTCADISVGCAGGTTEISGDCGNATQKCCKANAVSPGSSGSAAGGNMIQFINPLRYDTVQEVLGVFLAYTQGVIVTIALVFLVLGGIMYIFSGGDEKNTGTAKKMITAAMIGLAIGIAAPSFLKEIAAILNWGNGTNNIPAEVTASPSLMTIASNLLNFLLAMVGILAMLMIVVGGLMYFAAGGDEKRTDVAKNLVKFSIMGVAVALVSLIIVRTIASFFATT